ncbi:MAG TPA: acyl-CoA dehydrogenase family protein [Thermohalobaculum sp.]|nr:acyl-CoA dehydrogenase family protein [Thermohalobaculum sp.]
MDRDSVVDRELPAAAGPAAQPGTRGLNFYRCDPSLRGILALYLDAEARAALEPHLDRLGALVGARLDDLARAADRNPPALQHRDRSGEDRQRIEHHPAWEEMERLALGEFALTVMSHRAALGRGAAWPSLAKYALTYLFAQSEFGLLCPVNMTDSLTRTIRRYAAPELLGRYLPRLLADDPAEMFQGAMFMTERFAGSDVGATLTRAAPEGQHWRLWGDKWFCSNADADLALVLARPEGAGEGTRNLGLFLLPRMLEDGEPNHYRIVRLKEKLGTRAMPSGEIRLEGAIAYLVGDLGQGFKQMAEMVNQSRLSNGVRSAGIMRRAVHEALAVARGREAFGRRLIELPLMRRQLAKMIVPAEQALAIVGYTADCLDRADAGEAQAQAVRRILTPLVKLRACRDARKVTGDAMEARGGCGYIEEFIEPRLLREAHLGSIWEGTSNIIALDVIRAARKAAAHEALAETLAPLIETAPGDLRAPLAGRLAAAVAFTERVAREGASAEHLARQAATGLYNATTAVLLAAHATALGEPWRAEAARLVLLHRLGTADPLAPEVDDRRPVDALLAALAP